MNVKTVVKVMNFHSLLRVEKSRREADTFQTMSEELTKMIGIILSNKNFQLDKKIVVPSSNLPVLRIYMGSDLGFCGNVNSTINTELKKDSASDKILVGKRIRYHGPKETLVMTREYYENNFDKIIPYLEKCVKGKTWSAIELVYNHYYNISSVSQVVKKIYPIKTEMYAKSDDWDDYIIEDDSGNMLEQMLVSCLEYEIRIAAASAYASENIMRQNATTQSLKKLDEREVEEFREKRKDATQKAINKSIDSCIKQKILKGAK